MAKKRPKTEAMEIVNAPSGGVQLEPSEIKDDKGRVYNRLIVSADRAAKLQSLISILPSLLQDSIEQLGCLADVAEVLVAQQAQIVSLREEVKRLQEGLVAVTISSNWAENHKLALTNGQSAEHSGELTLTATLETREADTQESASSNKMHEESSRKISAGLKGLVSKIASMNVDYAAESKNASESVSSLERLTVRMSHQRYELKLKESWRIPADNSEH